MDDDDKMWKVGGGLVRVDKRKQHAQLFQLEHRIINEVVYFDYCPTFLVG